MLLLTKKLLFIFFILLSLLLFRLSLRCLLRFFTRSLSVSGGVAIESNFGGDFAYVLVVFGVVWSFA